MKIKIGEKQKRHDLFDLKMVYTGEMQKRDMGIPVEKSRCISPSVFSHVTDFLEIFITTNIPVKYPGDCTKMECFTSKLTH